MTRPRLLIPVFALAALLAVAPATASAAAGPKPHPASIEFSLPANNGLHAHLEGSDKVTLEIERKGRFVSYEAKGESTEAGLKAKFGKLGTIDVAFEPTKTDSQKPPKGCTGKPTTYSEGLFVGTIEFTGEREYVRIEADQVKGTMVVYRESEWRCHRRHQPGRRQGPSRSAPRKGTEGEEEPATLAAVDLRCGCYFAAFARRNERGRGPSIFFGAKVEKREGMEINRLTSANARASAFVFDHERGTATVRPPRPFSGSATFKRRRHGRDLWRSTIQVPLLGADPIRIQGRRYRARLLRDFPGD